MATYVTDRPSGLKSKGAGAFWGVVLPRGFLLELKCLLDTNLSSI